MMANEEDELIKVLEPLYNFIKKFKSQRSEKVLKAFDEDQMIAVEVVYEPFSLDAHGEWASEETIKKACDNFNKSYEKGVCHLNLFHMQDTDKLELLKSYVCDKPTLIGDYEVKKGTWIIEYKFLDENLWELRKANVVGGLSIGARGRRIKNTESEE